MKTLKWSDTMASIQTGIKSYLKRYMNFMAKKEKAYQKSERKKKDLKNKLDHLKYRTHMIESLQKNTLLCSCGNLMKCEYT